MAVRGCHNLGAANLARINEIDGTHSLTFYCGELPADESIAETGHQPNGYFWDGVVTYIARDIVDQLELDSEGGMFSAYGDLPLLERLRAMLEPYLVDGQRTAALIRMLRLQDSSSTIEATSGYCSLCGRECDRSFRLWP